MRGRCREIPDNGTKREITKFLIFPRCINQEWRWLEIATVEQEYCQDYVNYDAAWWECWYDKRWLNE